MSKCKYVYYDGAGHYCKLMPIFDPDYPHKHWRVDCHGNKDSLGCKDMKRYRYIANCIKEEK